MKRSAKAAPSAGRAAPRRALAAAILIVAAGVWAYAGSFQGVFALDDVRAIVQNHTIESLGGALSPPPMSTVSGRPVANLSLALDYAAGGLDSFAYHRTNLLIHLATALLLFGVLYASVPRVARLTADQALYVAASIAAIWVVHPLTTIAVTYVVQRVESLMAFFYLATLYCAIRAADEGSPKGLRYGQRVWNVGAVICCALGMGTKEAMVTAPVAVALWDVVFRPGERPRWRLYGLLAGTWVILGGILVYEHRAASLGAGAETAWRYALTQAAVIVHYLRLAFYPSPLVFLYTWPLATSVHAVWWQLLLVLSLLGVGVAALARRHPLGFAIVTFFVLLAPTSLVPIVTEVAAEQRMYLPLALVIAVVVVPAATIVRSRAAAGVLVATLVVVLGTVTRARNLDYASEEALWRDTVAKQPGNERARVAYGSILASAGRVADARREFEAAVSLEPQDAMALGRLGGIEAAQGEFDRAVPHLEKALALRPDDPEAHRTLGQIYARQGRDALAEPHFERAAQVVPNDPELAFQLAALLSESRDPMVRDPVRALPYAERAVTLTRRQEPLPLALLGSIQGQLGRVPEAGGTLREALALARARGDQALAAQIEQHLGR